MGRLVTDYPTFIYFQPLSTNYSFIAKDKIRKHVIEQTVTQKSPSTTCSCGMCLFTFIIDLVLSFTSFQFSREICRDTFPFHVSSKLQSSVCLLFSVRSFLNSYTSFHTHSVQASSHSVRLDRNTCGCI